MSKRQCLVFAALALGLLASTSVAAQYSLPVDVPASADLPHYTPTASISGQIRGVAGMDSVEAMMSAWAAAFKTYHPDTDISMVMRDLAPEERIALEPDTEAVFHTDNSAFNAKYGYDPFRIAICQGAFVLKSHVSAIGVFVSKANPLNSISLDKLDAVYSEERRRGYPADITTWGQLGLTGEWADKPIHIYGFYGRDDVTWYFRDIVSYDAPFKVQYRVPGEDMTRRTPVVAKDLMATLAADPYAIAFANFSYQSDQVKALGITDARGVTVKPELGAMISGDYPLQRKIYIYVNRKPGTPLAPLVKEFLTFVLSREGQDLVRKDHYLPLTPAMAAAERAKLN